MATVAALADRVCAVTGLADTGADRALVLGYLNQTYANSVLEAGGYIGTFSASLTANDDTYTIGTAPLSVTDLVEIRALWVTDQAVSYRPVRQVSERQIMDLRQGIASPATPLFYAVRGTTELLLYPAPQSGTVLEGSYLKSAPVLVESSAGAGEETTPSAIPSAFHFEVISNGALALAMEYENRFEEAAAYDAKWGNGIQRLLAWTSRFGGPTLTNVDDLGYEGPRDMDRF